MNQNGCLGINLVVLRYSKNVPVLQVPVTWPHYCCLATALTNTIYIKSDALRYSKNVPVHQVPVTWPHYSCLATALTNAIYIKSDALRYSNNVPVHQVPVTWPHYNCLATASTNSLYSQKQNREASIKKPFTNIAKIHIYLDSYRSK